MGDLEGFNPFIDVTEISFEELLSIPKDEVNRMKAAYYEAIALKKDAMADALMNLPKVPILVIDCIAYLRWNGGLDTEGIFRVNGDSQAVEKIRQVFIDHAGLADPLLSVQQQMKLRNYDVATALKSYFRLLNDPLVPAGHYEAMKQAVDDQSNHQPTESIKDQIRKMPEPNKSILAYTMIFFQDITANYKVNKMNANNLATCLTMSITRFMDVNQDPTKKANHLAAMLEVGMSTKIISLMLSYVDFTEFITPEKYLEFVMAGGYRRESNPKDMKSLLDHPMFDRMRGRYGDELRAKFGPPPVVKRPRKDNKYMQP